VEANGVALRRSDSRRAPGWWLETGANGADAGEELGRLVVAAGVADASASLTVMVQESVVASQPSRGNRKAVPRSLVVQPTV
jgi:hypothetical protein